MINLEDDSARVSISPTGQLDIRSKTSNWNMGLDPMNKGSGLGMTPVRHSQCRRWAGLCLRSRWSQRRSIFADEMIRQYQEQNPDYYRR